ncbi:hypothetical protein RHGRI_026005 [Rhododendron griersonianum]|uniref:Uncharacterized protein n=1 Tax=Rhododendron griersonianum TaxID=479676 RepID=A0AAV6IWN2_9ERIC|nr:hypothetical protein RHGRI_026005 [Rhododendron griersonianum]
MQYKSINEFNHERQKTIQCFTRSIATISIKGEGNLYCLAIVKSGDINIIGRKCLDMVKYYVAYSQYLREILSPFMYIIYYANFSFYGLV